MLSSFVFSWNSRRKLANLGSADFPGQSEKPVENHYHLAA
jgi:hypothetical protein